MEEEENAKLQEERKKQKKQEKKERKRQEKEERDRKEHEKQLAKELEAKQEEERKAEEERQRLEKLETERKAEEERLRKEKEQAEKLARQQQRKLEAAQKRERKKSKTAKTLADQLSSDPAPSKSSKDDTKGRSKDQLNTKSAPVSGTATPTASGATSPLPKPSNPSRPKSVPAAKVAEPSPAKLTTIEEVHVTETRHSPVQIAKMVAANAPMSHIPAPQRSGPSPASIAAQDPAIVSFSTAPPGSLPNPIPQPPPGINPSNVTAVSAAAAPPPPPGFMPMSNPFVQQPPSFPMQQMAQVSTSPPVSSAASMLGGMPLMDTANGRVPGLPPHLAPPLIQQHQLPPPQPPQASMDRGPAILDNPFQVGLSPSYGGPSSRFGFPPPMPLDGNPDPIVKVSAPGSRLAPIGSKSVNTGPFGNPHTPTTSLFSHSPSSIFSPVSAGSSSLFSAPGPAHPQVNASPMAPPMSSQSIFAGPPSGSIGGNVGPWGANTSDIFGQPPQQPPGSSTSMPTPPGISALLQQQSSRPPFPPGAGFPGFQ